MICSKCTHWEIPQVRMRMTPTFYHSPIFDQYNATDHLNHMRCSATYHSTVFDEAHNHRPSSARKSQCCCKQSTAINKQQCRQEGN